MIYALHNPSIAALHPLSKSERNYENFHLHLYTGVVRCILHASLGRHSCHPRSRTGRLTAAGHWSSRCRSRLVSRARQEVTSKGYRITATALTACGQCRLHLETDIMCTHEKSTSAWFFQFAKVKLFQGVAGYS